MRKILFVAALGLSLAGCQTLQSQRVKQGAIIGGVGGAAAGAVVAGSVKGAAIGGLAGAAAGATVGAIASHSRR